jgi:HlyD family secretion protein/hemolysin D
MNMIMTPANPSAMPKPASPKPAMPKPAPPLPVKTPGVLLRVIQGGAGLGLLPDEREFLPAALEVLDTPPSPAGRLLAFIISLIAVVGIAWAWIGHVDIVAVASGKIVAQMRTKVIQPFETSTVRAILVHPGQKVRAGEALIDLDPTAANAEREHARQDMIAADLDQIRLEAFLDDRSEAAFSAVAEASVLDIKRAQAQLTSQIAERAAKLGAIKQERTQRVAEKLALEQTLAKVQNTLPYVAERADIREKATLGGIVSVVTSLESQQALAETKGELEINRAKIDSLVAAIDGLDQKSAGTEAEIYTTALTDLSKARERYRAAAEQLAKANHRTDQQTLRAPINGTVQQLQVTTIGSVVTPAQQLLSVVPDEDNVEVEAVLENRDIGFVSVGQPVEIKIDAYPFTRYGLAKGTILAIDRDAEATPVNPASVRQGTERDADDLQNVEGSERLRYTVHIAIDGNSLKVDGRPGALLPGMSVKAEILTGKRRIVDFLLAPLSEHIHDSLHER